MALEFFDVEVVVGEAGDLGKVCDAEYLCLAREPLETLPYLLCHSASDAGVDFVENEGSGKVLIELWSCRANPGAGGAYDSLQGQHQARKLAA